MTAGQLAETAIHQWVARLPNRSDDDRMRWKLAFVAQVLDRYAMLRLRRTRHRARRGAAPCSPPDHRRGGLRGRARQALPPDHGVSDFAWSAVSCSALGSAADGAAGVPLSLADQPADSRGFDFLWSIGMAQLGCEGGHCANFLVELMSVLRPGGYAVHMLDLVGRAEAGARALAARRGRTAGGER